MFFTIAVFLTSDQTPIHPKYKIPNSKLHNSTQFLKQHLNINNPIPKSSLTSFLFLPIGMVWFRST